MQPFMPKHPLQDYRRFITSYYFYEGVRVTFGIMLPVLLGIYFRQSAWGIAAAIGALAAAITDFPGPLHHRINGMLAVTACVGSITLATGQLINSPVWLGVFIALAGFAFAIITVYGNRASQIGTASLVILTLLVDETREVSSYATLAGITVAGALLYLLLSLLLHGLRPYKLAQQVLGQCMQQTAAYLQVKAAFYARDPAFDTLYQELTQTQLQVNTAQQNVREIFFKTRSITRESTHTSRVLVLAFMDLVDLFESMMASQPNYRLMQAALPGHPLLDAFRQLLQHMAHELEQAGMAFAAGKPYPPDGSISHRLAALNELFAETRQQELDSETIEAFITLRHALDALEDMIEKLLKLQHYSTYHRGIRLDRKLDYQRFVVPSYFSGRQVLNNLSWQSSVFRFSLRMMAAMTTGYLVSLFLPLGHAYWVLLTVVVILKPAYAITRQRNRDRLLGTALGVALGAAVLYTTANNYVLLGVMLGFMILSFSSWRHRYFWSVLTLTVFIVIAMHLLHPGDFTALIQDRLVDTVIGSAIALSFTLLIPPVWEKILLPQLATEAIQANRQYFDEVAGLFEGRTLSMGDYKLHRKKVYVALANFSDAFQRMTQEPRQMQEKAPYWQQLVVSTHVLASHTAALFTEVQDLNAREQLHAFLPITRQVSNRLLTACSLLNTSNAQLQMGAATGMEDIAIRREVKALLLQRRNELERGEWETTTKERLVALKSVLDQLDMMLQLSGDIRRICRKM
ncbi:MAG: FUSC family protein [Chitinophagaceae bacterium]|jgi:uncharacterized membrane protein YccC|nr:FUSC family protein [Chitinophagaceae bacterium]